jgi:putative two-component system response regulator
MKIMVVDDNETCRLLTHATLSRAGHEVVVASDGDEAFRIIESQQIRIVVSDWEMPGLSGPDLCRRIRTAGMPHYVYVLLVTSHGLPEERVAGLSSGADDFIAKPFHPAELIERVRAAERIIAMETRDVTIFALAKLAESRDPETGAHLERVRSYCRLLSQHLSMSPKFQAEIDSEFIRLMYLTSPLHDIGKVGIPDSVLLKPDRLNDREYEIMKKHAAIGAETLSAALLRFPDVPFLRMARDIAATHHERWDGSGYPDGLAGEAIPLAGRIMAVADVYDALSSRRVYKAAYTHEVAKSMIVSDSGTHFDPDVVQAFLSAEPGFLEIRRRFHDAPSEAA